MFDAGAIMAHLDIDLGSFNRKMDAAEQRVRDFERGRHEIRVSAVFDNASLGRARQIFTQLDQQLSREAMQRLRSSPQGSVLGAINALFSPHPVSGGPSPQQSASQGLLGRIVGGGTAGGGTSRVILGQMPGNASNTPVRVTVDNIDALANALGGGGDSSSAPSPDPTATRAATASERAAAQSRAAAQNSADASRAAASAARDSNSSSRTLFGGLRNMFGGGGGGGHAFLGGAFGGAEGARGAVRNLGSGIGPSILGLSTRVAGIAGLGASALGAVPALAGVGAVAGVGALGAGFIGLGAKQLIGTKNVKGQPATQGPLYAQAQQAKDALESTMREAATGMLKPLREAFSQIPMLLSRVGPAMRQAFAGAGTLILPIVHGLTDLAVQVLPLLGQAFRAAAPLLQPLIDGLGGLLAGILPGVTRLLRASAPAVAAFSRILAMLGRDIGAMLSDFAPVIRQSSVIFEAIFKVIGALLPAVGQLAAIFARTLAPIFSQFASVVRSFIPFLTILGKLMAQLASAVLGDLVAAFGALASLLRAIAPALTIFATAFGHIFTVLENSGVFAIVGDALEAIVKPLGRLISALLTGLAPILPPVIRFLGDLSAILVAQLSRAIIAILPPLTRLATVALAALAQLLPVILPLITAFVSVFTASLADTIVVIANGLNSLITAIPPRVLRGMVEGILGIVAAVKLWRAYQALLDVELSANPIGILIIALTALTVGLVEAWKHSATFRNVIKDIGIAVLSVASQVVRGAKILADALLSAFSGIIHGAASAFGWVPGLGPKLRTAAQHFDSFRAGVDNVFNRMLGTLDRWQRGLQDSQSTADRTSRKIMADFDGQDKAAGRAKGEIDVLTAAIINHGAKSDAVRQSRRRLINDLTDAGVDAKTARTDVDRYTNAVSHHSSTSDAVRGARQRLIEDIVSASYNSRKGKTDLAFLTQEVAHHGTTSDTYRNARLRLIRDLENAGLNAHQASRLVDGLASSIRRVPGSKSVTITMTGHGSYTIAGRPVSFPNAPIQLATLGKAAGGLITGGIPGRDSVVAALMPGELVVPTKMVQSGEVDHLKGRLPGFAGGGLVLRGQQGALSGYSTGAMYNDFERRLEQIVTRVGRSALKAVENMAMAASGIGGSYGDSGARSASAAIAQAFARSIMPQFGWPASMWPAWLALGNEESGWNAYAVNAASGAYGIGQALGHGHPYNLGDYKTQVIWMADYIRSRYGNPVKAYAFENSHSPAWYSKGGLVPPGRAFANGGMITEPIIGFGRSGQQYTFGEHGNEWVTPFQGPNAGHGPGRSTQLAEVLNIMLPEGGTLAQAFAELNFRLAVAQQQGWVGVPVG